jgi:hypothetical protein
MATGDTQDITARLKGLLPNGWFRGPSPVLDAILSGIATALAAAYSLFAYVRLQTRVATATDGFLDLIALDYFGGALKRRLRESDDSYRARILAALLAEKGTRQGLIRTLVALTGRTPVVFEPERPADTGGYGVGGVGYGVAGGYGALTAPYQAFVTAFRPVGQGIPNLGGYSSGVGGYSVGGQLAYADLSQVQGAVTDADIYEAISDVIEAGTIAWTAIQS